MNSKYKNLKFNKLTVKDGLSTNHIFNTFEDSRGFIWFTALDGLNRFDGRRIKTYKNDINDERSIGKGFVLPIIEDKDKTIWVGTVLGGLCRYNRETDDFIRYINNPDDAFSISDDFVKCILEDEEGFLWIGTQKGVLNKFDKLTGKFYQYKFECGDDNSPSGSGIVKLYLDSKKNLWVCDRGLIMFDKKSGKCIRFVNDINNSDSISCNDTGSIYEDDKGILWISTNGGGLNKFDPSTGTFKHYRHDEANPESSCIDYIYDICKDDFGMIWIVSLKKTGQAIFDPVKEEFFVYGYNSLNEYGINSGGVLQLYKDSSGTMWLSTLGTGVYYYNENKWRFEHYISDPANPDSLSSNDIGAMCEDKRGNLWIATTKGLNVFSKENKKINDQYGNPDFFNSLKADDELKLCCDINGSVWISHGDEGLLDMYDYETNEFIRYDNNLHAPITCLYEDREGLLWVVYLKYGMKVFNKERTEWKAYEYKAGDISFHTAFSIMEDNESNIWFGTYYDGIHILNKKTGKFTTLVNDPKDINSLNIASLLYPLYQDRKGSIWIGTHAHGLDKFDPKRNKFTHYTEKQGLANNYIQGILEDEHDNLWISTNKGISKFTSETETFRNFDVNDGLQGDEFCIYASLKRSDGKMYFGGTNGLTSFYPDNITVNKRIPKIVLTGFKIFNKDAKLDVSITEAKKINLSHKENFFTIEFAALDFTNPLKNQYAYKLDGVDKKWNYVGNSDTASYTNISPGNYEFRVKGSNNDGVWNEEGVSVKIIIKPPFYKTIWFEGLSALGMISGMGIFISQRFEKIKKEKTRQEEFTKKIIESQENERKRFASELHDGLGQDLIIIKNKAQISFNRTNEISKFKEQMKEISELASTTINEAREISQNLRPNILDTLGLTRTLLSMIERAENSTSIKFYQEVDNIDNVFAQEADINVYRILQECLTNIIKHSEAKEVFVKVKKSEKEISMLISDNGKGFDVRNKLSDPANNGFGLKGIPERVKLFGGSFKIYSEIGKGTKISIILPVDS